jgi:hypothetical protein
VAQTATAKKTAKIQTTHSFRFSPFNSFRAAKKNIPYLGFKASVQPTRWSATVGPGLQSADFAHGGIELTALVGGE